jgi:hypothetical protein
MYAEPAVLLSRAQPELALPYNGAGIPFLLLAHGTTHATENLHSESSL